MAFLGDVIKQRFTLGSREDDGMVADYKDDLYLKKHPQIIFRCFFRNMIHQPSSNPNF